MNSEPVPIAEEVKKNSDFNTSNDSEDEEVSALGEQQKYEQKNLVFIDEARETKTVLENGEVLQNIQDDIK